MRNFRINFKDKVRERERERERKRKRERERERERERDLVKVSTCAECRVGRVYQQLPCSLPHLFTISG